MLADTAILDLRSPEEAVIFYQPSGGTILERE